MPKAHALGAPVSGEAGTPSISPIQRTSRVVDGSMSESVAPPAPIGRASLPWQIQYDAASAKLRHMMALSQRCLWRHGSAFSDRTAWLRRDPKEAGPVLSRDTTSTPNGKSQGTSWRGSPRVLWCQAPRSICIATMFTMEHVRDGRRKLESWQRPVRDDNRPIAMQATSHLFAMNRDQP